MGSDPTGGLRTPSPTFHHHWCTSSYEWVLEADIKACFDKKATTPLS